MNYIQIAGIMASNEKNPNHSEHIYDFVRMCEQCVKDLCPQIVKEELEKLDSELWVKIQTQIDGRNVDFPDIRTYIRELIEDELRKMVKEIRL